MKKGRPSVIVQVLADEALLPTLTEALFRETSTIGVRSYPVTRTVMDREPVTLHTAIGDIVAKRCTHGDLTRVYPEYESVRAVAQTAGVPLPEAFAIAQTAAQALVAQP